MPKELDPCPAAVRKYKPHPSLRVHLAACCLPHSLGDGYGSIAVGAV